MTAGRTAIDHLLPAILRARHARHHLLDEAA